MSGFLGANPDELDALAQALNAYASALDMHRRQINSQVHSAPWRGRRADEFRSEWDHRYSPLLLQAISAMNASELILRANARQQEWASAAPAAVGAAPLLRSVTEQQRPPSILVSARDKGEAISANWGWLLVSVGSAIPHAGLPIAAATAVDQGYRLVQDLSKGNFSTAFDQGANMASSSLMGAAVNSGDHFPVLFWASTDMAIAGDVVEAASTINWGYTFSHLSELNPITPGNLAIYGQATVQGLNEVGIQVGEEYIGSIVSDL